MKKIITLLLLLSSFCVNAQIEKAVNDLIDSKVSTALKDVDAKITTALSSFDTVAVVSVFTASGIVYPDTLLVPINKGAWFKLNLSGGKLSAKQEVYILNTNGTYTISGLVTSAPLTVVILNKIPVVKINGTTDTIEWKLTRINL
jgi:hypothetical protein